MTQVLSLIALIGLLLSFVQAAPAQREPTIHPSGTTPPDPPSAALARPDEQLNGARLNGSPSQALGPNGRFAVEGLELPDGTALGR